MAFNCIHGMWNILSFPGHLPLPPSSFMRQTNLEQQLIMHCIQHYSNSLILITDFNIYYKCLPVWLLCLVILYYFRRSGVGGHKNTTAPLNSPNMCPYKNVYCFFCCCYPKEPFLIAHLHSIWAALEKTAGKLSWPFPLVECLQKWPYITA